jgi:hypothetical protein
VPTNDGFNPDNPLPLFLSRHAEEEYEPPRASRRLAASVFLTTATAIGIAFALSWENWENLENPAKLLADITASLPEIPFIQRSPVQPAPAIQAAADAQALPPIAREASVRLEIATTSDAVNQSQPETREAPAADLLKQFQVWAAEQDARIKVEPVRPVQDVQDKVLQIAQEPVQHAQRHRRIRPVRDARAEIRRPRYPRATIRDQNARVAGRPVEDARAQDQSAPTAQLPSFLQGLGQHQ